MSISLKRQFEIRLTGVTTELCGVQFPGAGRRQAACIISLKADGRKPAQEKIQLKTLHAKHPFATSYAQSGRLLLENGVCPNVLRFWQKKTCAFP